ncbi:MAG: hypothetical protein GWP07_06170 [Xanthomonadaceae bacterium]|nr:hypothetical protein [Xanthomonadaceae bacterium]
MIERHIFRLENMVISQKCEKKLPLKIDSQYCLQNKCQQYNLLSIKIINYNKSWEFNYLLNGNNFILKSLAGISAFCWVETGGFWKNEYFFR